MTSVSTAGTVLAVEMNEKDPRAYTLGSSSQETHAAVAIIARPVRAPRQLKCYYRTPAANRYSWQPHPEIQADPDV